MLMESQVLALCQAGFNIGGERVFANMRLNSSLTVFLQPRQYGDMDTINWICHRTFETPLPPSS